MKGQKTSVLKYLEENDCGITSLVAFRQFQITRLSAIIFDLRALGYKISTTIEEGENGSRYARYRLED